MNKTAIVTGGGRGIGLAIVKQLAADGMNVSVMGSSPEDTYREAFDEIRKTGADVLYIQGSIDNADDRQRCVNETVKKFGSIDVLVNNAGVAPKVRADLLEMTEESFDHVIGINLKGTMFFTQLVAKQMIGQEKSTFKRGTIVNVSSISATVSSVNRGEYCISKAGISMLTTLYADRLADEGIFVYEVRPGVIATDMTSKVKEKYDELIKQGMFPIKRWGYPEDIANAVSLLCSDKMTYSTGDHLNLDGGFHIRRL
ncbi:3-oxoacyl-[acyl-carrier-protein] reductase FabG [Oxobacter pfennigii]|uniref:3-oxoacyl-[acyl-carrier-protein] reductase FabG n=1 Tax=Oxobacter pfennigii TaxID=36849 RepID=A0A0P8W923_9CLOT|nr:3-ketoacyl-ACP reductase [Oxobacter pfennigii]KPU44519.1 3-oxoacyl-[acyl-carrier-protein] reductase FabG [Oxobacter pfennigii]